MRAVLLAPPGHSLATALLAALEEPARRRGFQLEHATQVEGSPELVIETPPEEVPVQHYHERGIPEIWRIDPETRRLEIYRLWADSYDLVAPTTEGVVRSPALEVDLSAVEGPRLRIAWPDGAVEV